MSVTEGRGAIARPRSVASARPGFTQVAAVSASPANTNQAPGSAIPGVGWIFRDIAAGGVVAVISIAYCISFAALIFAGSLGGSFSAGLDVLLLGTGLTGIMIALGSALPRAVGGPDTPAVAVFSALAAAVAASLPSGTPADAVAASVLAAIAIATLVTGLLLLGLGLLRLGSVVRFVPFSVVAGFLAASGCLLVGGAFRVATGHRLGLAQLAETLSAATPEAGKVAFAVCFAIAIFAVRRRYRHFIVLPAAVLGASVVAHLLAAIGRLDAAAGWFLHVPRAAGVVPPVPAPDRLLAVLPMLGDHVGEIAAVAVVTAMAIILNTSGLEAVWKTNSDLDREFRVTGMANLFAGLAGGIAGNLSLNRSMLNGECGATGRLSAVIPGVACLTFLFVSRDFLALVPTPVIAGLLLFLGTSIVINSVSWATLRRDWPELLLILLIAGLILAFGYLEGLLVGVVGACLLFAYTYSRISIIKHEFTRKDRSSNVERSIEHATFLSENGRLIRVTSLQGYLFFATSSRLVEYLRRRFQARDGTPIAYMIIGFRLVSGIDISAVLSLVKLRNECEKRGVRLIFYGLSHGVAEMLYASKQRLIDGETVRQFGSLHEALEWAEDDLLRRRGAHLIREEGFEQWLGAQVRAPAVAHQLVPFFERHRFDRGEYLVRQGEPSDSIDLVITGRVGIVLERPEGAPIRLRSMLGHTVLGEMGFYRSTPRTASVVAEDTTTIYRLDRGAFDRMAAENPAAAESFHRFIIRVLADRLSFANSEIAILDL